MTEAKTHLFQTHFNFCNPEVFNFSAASDKDYKYYGKWTKSNLLDVSKGTIFTFLSGVNVWHSSTVG